MKIITVTYDGHINSIGFKDWDEARGYILARIPEGSYMRTDTNTPHWVNIEYLVESEDGTFRKHAWELNEVSVRSKNSS